MQRAIEEFQGEHRWLSNFWFVDLVFEGMLYPTVEHAYQAAKTFDGDARDRIANLATPGQAKREGAKLRLRDGWELDKRAIMMWIVRAKFQNAELAKKLRATGDAELIEGNRWNDRYWGVCRGEGRNELGKILMEVREEIA